MQKCIAKEKTKHLVLTTALVGVVAMASSTGATGSPYPPSSVIKSITWHWDTHTTAAPGSDLWPVTWASNGNIYTAWGDGGGFNGTNSDGRVSMGFARIEGAPESYVGINVNGGKDSENPTSFPKKGKSGGILSVRGTLYARLNLQDGEWPDVNFALAWSEDMGATWTKTSWVFPKGQGNFKPSRFLNFGRDYTGVPAHLAGFVYFYGFKQDTDSGSGKSTYMGRVPRGKLKDRSAYEFFKGLGADGKPIWTSDVKEIQPVFTDSNGACLGGVVYNPGIKRYILTSYHTGPGQLGIFDAPEPWGPWTTVAYYDDWGNMGAAGFGLNCDFPQKWMSTDGITMWCVFSVYGDGARKGINSHDKFNLVKATLVPLSNEDYGMTNRDNDRIQIYKENPRYWQYKGKPVLLLGGSVEDNLFQIPELEEHLDLLESVGGNYVRNTMSSRDEGNVWPFAKEGSVYDLNKPNVEYWRRFENMLKLTTEREIIVQIELWDRFDFARDNWNRNPYNPKNNINYTVEESGLKETIKTHPGKRESAFFRSVPALENNRVVLRYQQAQVDKMLSISLQYGNVLYCMDNETNESSEWGAYWSNYIRKKAAEAGAVTHTTEMWAAYDLMDDLHKRTYDHPETYSFCDISQNNHNRGQKHWDNIEKVRAYLTPIRPINSVKIYGSDEPYRIAPPGARDGVGGRYGRDRDGLERFWRQIFGGMASSRFHRPTSGLGLTEKARAHIKSMRMLTGKMDVFTCEPHNDLLSNRKENGAYVIANPGKEYAVYFPNGDPVALDLSAVQGRMKAGWLDIAQSQWAKEEMLEGGGTVILSPPGTGHWAVWIGPVSTSQKVKIGSRRAGASLIKASLGPAPAPQVLVLTSPEKWRLVQDEGYTGRNAREFFFTLETEAGLPPPEVEVKWPGVEIERVLGADGNTTRTSEGVRFRLAQNNGAPVKTITSIDYGKNVNLILFHNWIIRRAGKYRTGRWPANEIQAQLNYLLAAREVCFDMGLAEAPDPGFVGSVGLYGFETNFPHGHVDHPPHFHILLVWPGWLSTQATHFRLDPEGSILHNEFHVNDGRNITSKIFERGETCSCEDKEGRVGFQLTILENGSGVIWSWPDRADYMMKADSIAGSAVDAVEVFKKINGDWERIRWVRVEYHVSLGLLKVHLSYADGKAVMEEIHFDPDTGKLLKSNIPEYSPQTARSLREKENKADDQQ